MLVSALINEVLQTIGQSTSEPLGGVSNGTAQNGYSITPNDGRIMVINRALNYITRYVAPIRDTASVVLPSGAIGVPFSSIISTSGRTVRAIKTFSINGYTLKEQKDALFTDWINEYDISTGSPTAFSNDTNSVYFNMPIKSNNAYIAAIEAFCYPIVVTSSSYILVINSIASAGTGYAVGDTITFAGGTFTYAATATVTSVSSSGAITGASVTYTGEYTATYGGVVTQGSTSGAGTGATFNVTTSLSVIDPYFDEELIVLLKLRVAQQLTANSIDNPNLQMRNQMWSTEFTTLFKARYNQMISNNDTLSNYFPVLTPVADIPNVPQKRETSS